MHFFWACVSDADPVSATTSKRTTDSSAVPTRQMLVEYVACCTSHEVCREEEKRTESDKGTAVTPRRANPAPLINTGRRCAKILRATWSFDFAQRIIIVRTTQKSAGSQTVRWWDHWSRNSNERRSACPTKGRASNHERGAHTHSHTTFS